eukprot:3970736-Prymnesium_polylepis.1
MATSKSANREPHKSGYRSESETLGRTNARPVYRKCTQYAFPSHYALCDDRVVGCSARTACADGSAHRSASVSRKRCRLHG